jgi:TusA-related sulfurtransferase
VKFTIIDEADAPPPPAEAFSPDDDTRETLREMKPGESIEVWPAPDETLAGIKRSFTRVAKKENMMVGFDKADAGRAIKVLRLR